MLSIHQIAYLICILSISGTSIKISSRPLIFQRQKPGGRQKNFLTPPYRGLNASRIFKASSERTINSLNASSFVPSSYTSTFLDFLNSNSYTEPNDLPISTSSSNIITATSVLLSPTNTLVLTENSFQAVNTLFGDSLLLSSYDKRGNMTNQFSGNMRSTDSVTVPVHQNSNETLSNRTLWKTNNSSTDFIKDSSPTGTQLLTAALMPTSALPLEITLNRIKQPVITKNVSTDTNVSFTNSVTLVSSASSHGYLTNSDQLQASFPSTVLETILVTSTPTMPITQSLVQHLTATVQTEYKTAPPSSIKGHPGIDSNISSTKLASISDASFSSSLYYVNSNTLPVTGSKSSMVYTSPTRKQTDSSQPSSLSVLLNSWTTATVQSPVTSPASTTVSSISRIYGAHSVGTTPNAYTCPQMSLYFPAKVEIDESEPVGTVLASMPTASGSSNLTFTVTVNEPMALTTIMKGYFKVEISSSVIYLVLAKPVDVEQLYHLTGKTTPVKELLVELECTETLYSSIVKETFSINITIWDEDDESPRFQNQDDDKTCVIPVYKADASEDYMGELTTKPGKLEAVDGDLFIQHNISYAVMHAEPENYHVYFSLNTFDGSVNKTRLMNASDPRKYVLFIQAIEDSPQQKKKVAVLSIEVFAPSDPLEDYTHEVDPTVKLSLKVASALVLLGFATGFIVLVHYRWRRKRGRLDSNKSKPCELARDMKIEFAVYQSSCSSLECEQTESSKDNFLDTPSIISPSQLQVVQNIYHMGSKKTRKVIVKKPIDTKLRPGWNAPTLKKKPVVYSPYKTTNITKLV